MDLKSQFLENTSIKTWTSMTCTGVCAKFAFQWEYQNANGVRIDFQISVLVGVSVKPCDFDCPLRFNYAEVFFVWLILAPSSLKPSCLCRRETIFRNVFFQEGSCADPAWLHSCKCTMYHARLYLMQEYICVNNIQISVTSLCNYSIASYLCDRDALWYIMSIIDVTCLEKYT